MTILNDLSLFLIQTLFNMYIFIVMLRIVLQWVGVDFTNPIFQFSVRLTNLPLKPIRRIIPLIHGIDIGAIVFLLLLEVIKLLILLWLPIHAMPNVGGLLILAFAEILGLLINIFSVPFLF